VREIDPVLGLPDCVRLCLFDLDGVLTKTATVHAAAWRRAFDDFLREREGPAFRPFDPAEDYQEFVDGKPRHEGVRDFLASRGIVLPEGSPDDPPSNETNFGLGNRKDVLLHEEIALRGVDAFAGSVRYLRAATAAGLHRVVVSSSANAKEVLEAAGLAEFVEQRVDGHTLVEQRLRGKPFPDAFLAGARLMGIGPDEAAVFEDSLAGVEAGHDGGFAYVVGVDRAGQARALRARGADVVVTDLAQLLEDP
jgi:beta-phosphoglucomutase family hydrolase